MEQQTDITTKQSSNKKRGKPCSLQFWKDKGGQVMSDLKVDLENKLFFGFSNLNIAAAPQNMQSTDNAKSVPISSKAIGFYIQSIFTKIYQLYNQFQAWNNADFVI